MKMEDWLINNECTYEVMQEDATHGSERQSGDLLGDIFLFYTLQIRANKLNISLKYSDTCIKHGAWRQRGQVI